MNTHPRQRSRALVALLGAGLLASILAVTAVVLVGFNGRFSTYDVVYADVPASGNGITAGSPVVYRDITVGSVASIDKQLGEGIVRASLHITPGELSAIPSGVSADVGITTVFGTQGITLVPPAHIGDQSLEVGQTVLSVNRSDTTTLQGDITDIDNILNALRPASLDAALTAVATAFDNRGEQLGRTLSQLQTYLGQLVPQLPTLEQDLSLSGPAATGLATSAPNIVTSLANVAVTANTLQANASELHQLLVGAVPVTNQVSSLLATTQNAFADLVTNSAELLGDVAANPQEIPQIVKGFDDWSKGFAAAETGGPFLSFSGNLDIAGSAQLVLAALSVPGSNVFIEQGLGPQNFDPKTYTAADCPRYGSEAGPNCPAASSSTTGRTKSASASPWITLTPAEVQAAAAIAADLSGGHQPASSSVAALLLDPLLQELAGGS